MYALALGTQGVLVFRKLQDEWLRTWWPVAFFCCPIEEGDVYEKGQALGILHCVSPLLLPFLPLHATLIWRRKEGVLTNSSFTITL